MKHYHKCPVCEYVWGHDEKAGGDDKAHTCPRCGCKSGDCWYRYQPTLKEMKLLAEGGNNPDRERSMKCQETP